MKMTLRSLFAFVMMIVIVQMTFELKLRNRLRHKLKQNYGQIWKILFQGSREQSCAGVALKKKIIAAAKAEAEELLHGRKAKKGRFAWVKNWGYGQSAYVFDYLDPVIRPQILKEFHSIYDEMMKFPSADTKDYKDPFDLRKLLSASKDNALNAKALKDLKLLNKNYDPPIYSASVNAVQLRKAIIDWRWSFMAPDADYAALFIKAYDMNGDGRLNPRELLLGSIDHNKHLFGTKTCTHCFEEVTKAIDAIFTFMDCDNDGYVTAEDMWNYLPKLRRPSDVYNMFALGLDAGIRTASVNDFILKNMNSKGGALNKVEFRNAVILGVWDRQTDYYKIIEDDSLTLKDLRWENEIVDIKGKDFIKESIIQQAQKK